MPKEGGLQHDTKADTGIQETKRKYKEAKGSR